MKNVTSGVLVSSASMMESAAHGMARGAAYVSGNEELVRRRDDRRRENIAFTGGALSGLKAGGASVVDGFKSGLSGIVTRPMEEGRKAGALGVMKGLGLGLAGAVVRPMIGLTDGLVSVAQGLNNELVGVTVVGHFRPPRALERSVLDLSRRIVAPLDVSTTRAQEFVVKEGAKEGITDSFIISTNGQSHILTLSDKYIYLLSLDSERRIKEVKWKMQYGDISHCVFQPAKFAIDFVLYQGGNEEGSSGKKVRSLACEDQAKAMRLYSVLWALSPRFGAPSRMPAPDLLALALPDPDGDASPASIGTGTTSDMPPMDGFKFGDANASKFPSTANCSEGEVLARGASRFAAIRDAGDSREFFSRLDLSAVQLMQEWQMAHPQLKSSRCCATVVINRSDNPIQVLRTDLAEGKAARVMGVGGPDSYDEEAMCVMPLGVAVVFAHGFVPSLVDLAHVQVNIVTTAFSARCATRNGRTGCTAVGGYRVSFLEKSVTEWWAKFVILVA